MRQRKKPRHAKVAVVGQDQLMFRIIDYEKYHERPLTRGKVATTTQPFKFERRIDPKLKPSRGSIRLC
jgi:hypothetical protein